MDHEKPEVVMPRVYDYASENTRSTLSPDIDYPNEKAPSIEEPIENVEDRRERRGESLW